jgi:hypothetical protein
MILKILRLTLTAFKEYFTHQSQHLTPFPHLNQPINQSTNQRIIKSTNQPINKYFWSANLKKKNKKPPEVLVFLEGQPSIQAHH